MKKIFLSLPPVHLRSLLPHLGRDAVWHAPRWVIACAFTIIVVLMHAPICRASPLHGVFAELKVSAFILQVVGQQEQSAGAHSADKLSFIEIAGLIIAIVALVAVPFAMKQYFDAKEQTEKLKEATTQLSAQTKRLEDIWSSLSTQYLGVFPNYLDDIVKLLEGAHKSIIIFCDYPAYGCYSDPDQWLKYKQTIERKIQDEIDVRLTCMNAERRRQYHRDQFKSIEQDWKEFIFTEPNHDLLKRFYQRYRNALDSPNKKIEELSFDDFEKLMAEANQSMLNEVFADAKEPPVELGVDMPLYFWLVDGAHAVFAIPSLSDEATEHGFKTGEAKLITAFLDMRSRYLGREAAK